MKKNLFIAFEGIDGSGKSTQAKLLAQRLVNEGHHVYSTFEPTKSEMGVLLRDIFSGKKISNQKTIASLFLADRFHHLLNEEDGLIKKMEDGYTVICDRYYFSSYAYHSVYMPMEWVIEINKPCAQLLKPDVTFFIDVDPEICMQRINVRHETKELYETLENLTTVREKYMEAFELLKAYENIIKIQGNRSYEKITDEILNEILAIDQNG